jgi:hypothetical protein
LRVNPENQARSVADSAQKSKALPRKWAGPYTLFTKQVGAH